jgi:epoxyqueuosine reductase
MIDNLAAWALQRGYRVAWGPISVIEDVRREIAGRFAASQIDDQFFEHELRAILGSKFDDSERTAVIVAKPCPAHLVHFELDGKSIDALLPPTYFRYRALFEEVRHDLAENGLPGARTEILTAPLKAVASRLGLISYGRNNITYVEGMGSYFQLCGYLTDVALPEMGLKPGSLLEQCEDCGVCLQMCPTGAIEEERILLRAEKCLTYVNENAGDWPDWLDQRGHNSLLGCLECQRCCPVNPELQVQDTAIRFSKIETRILLSQDLSGMDTGAENGIRIKLAWLGQPYAEPVLGRNLRALLRATGMQM